MAFAIPLRRSSAVAISTQVAPCPLVIPQSMKTENHGCQNHWIHTQQGSKLASTIQCSICCLCGKEMDKPTSKSNGRVTQISMLLRVFGQHATTLLQRHGQGHGIKLQCSGSNVAQARVSQASTKPGSEATRQALLAFLFCSHAQMCRDSSFGYARNDVMPRLENGFHY